MAAAGLELDDVSEVVLTHAHGDHIDGLVHVRGRVLINETELRFLGSPMAAGDAPRLCVSRCRQGSLPSPSRSTTGRSGRSPEAGRSAMTDASSPSRPPGTRRATSP